MDINRLTYKDTLQKNFNVKVQRLALVHLQLRLHWPVDILFDRLIMLELNFYYLYKLTFSIRDLTYY